MKKILLIIFLLNSHLLRAQTKTKINLCLRQTIQEHPSAVLNLLVKGNLNSMMTYARSHGGVYKYGYGKVASMALPANVVLDFSQQPFVERIEFSCSKGRVMNDSMIVNNKVAAVHAGMAPLKRAYDGEGVVMGFIDSGIDFTHPDFQDSLGNTRVKFIWDQEMSTNASAPQPFGYGQSWNENDINNGLCTHDDHPAFFGHGSTVAGAGAGNGLALNKYKGVAPKADIIVVATDFNASNWLSTVADAVNYIFNKADSLGKPCVINASVGDYWGSHDGRDIAAQLIDSMILEHDGRVMVCAAGNSGGLKYHLSSTVDADTNFTWFTYNPSFQGVYFALWADTADFNNVEFALGADQVTPSYVFKGGTKFDIISNRLNLIYDDTILSNGGVAATIQTFAEQVDDSTYFMEFYMDQPDSTQFNYRLMTTGSGKFDIWSSAGLLGTSDMVSSGLPSSVVFPDMVNYQLPDANQTMVSSFACSPNVITVANYTNRKSYVDVNGNTQTPDTNAVIGRLAASSSWGPTRTHLQKPNITASGDLMLSPSRLATLASLIISEPFKVALGGMHGRNGGTSMASPVVAGAAALYLQQCSEASHLDVMNALYSTASTDTFTGAVPNNQWGVGKLNTFQALANSVFTPQISIVGTDSFYCNVNGSAYQWYANDTAIIGATGQYFAFTAANTTYKVEATSNSGCSFFSDEYSIEGINEQLAHSFTIYPNPSAGELFISNPTHESLQLKIYTGLGQCVYNGIAEPGTTKIDISQQPKGIYTVVIEQEDGIVAKKVVVL